jgi:hypothetical protein
MAVGSPTKSSDHGKVIRGQNGGSAQRLVESCHRLSRMAVVNSSKKVAGRLKELARSSERDELAIVTWTHNPFRHAPMKC